MMTRSALLLVPLLLLALPGMAQQEADPLKKTVEQAVAALEAGKKDEAIRLLESVRTESTPPPILGLLGAVYVEAGRAADALAVLAPLAAAESADPAVLYNAGRAALGLGRGEEGERYLERSVAIERGTPAARELGLVRASQGRFVEAYALLRPWALAHPDDGEARSAAALCAVSLRRLPEAEQLLEGVPADLPGVRLLRGRILHLKGDPQGAIAQLEPLVAGAPTMVDADARRSLAESYLAAGNAQAAVKMLAGHVEGRPLGALQLAKAQYQSGDLAAALATLEPFARHLASEAGASERTSSPRIAAEICLDHGRYLTAAQRAAEAVPFLELATQLAPEDKQGWQALGQTLAATGRREDAERALARFQKLASQEKPPSERDLETRAAIDDPVVAQLRRAAERFEAGKHEEAVAILRRESEISPTDLRPRLLLASALISLRRPAEALEVIEAALRIAPETADLHYQLGVTKMALGDQQTAETAYRRALELAPEHTATMNDLAVLLMVRGDTGSARGLLERVLELHPEDATARANLSKIAEARPGRR